MLSRHILAFGISLTGRFRYPNPDKPACATWMPEVVDLLLNRDLNLLCRIEEMRKAQLMAQEERRERWLKRRRELW
jgi:hypothetical protein